MHLLKLENNIFFFLIPFYFLIASNTKIMEIPKSLIGKDKYQTKETLDETENSADQGRSRIESGYYSIFK